MSNGGKGDKRRPGSGYAEGHDRIDWGAKGAAFKPVQGLPHVCGLSGENFGVCAACESVKEGGTDGSQ